MQIVWAFADKELQKITACYELYNSLWLYASIKCIAKYCLNAHKWKRLR